MIKWKSTYYNIKYCLDEYFSHLLVNINKDIPTTLHTFNCKLIGSVKIKF